MLSLFRLCGVYGARQRGAASHALTRVWRTCTTVGNSSTTTIPPHAPLAGMANAMSSSSTAAAEALPNVAAHATIDKSNNSNSSSSMDAAFADSTGHDSSKKNVMYGINEGDETHPDFQPRIVATDLAEDEVAMIKKDIRDTIQSEDVVVFIKGVPEAPMCAFSKRMIDIMEALGLEYTSFDVLAHPVVRIYVKTLSEWPTIPQLFVKGDFVGGMDIVLKMAESGDLQMLLDSKSIKHRDQQQLNRSNK